MKWKGRKSSSNVQDRRGRGSSFGGMGGGIGMLGALFRLGGSKLGLAVIVILIVISVALKINPLELLSGSGNYQQAQQTEQTTAATDELGQFVSVVLQDTEDVWNTLFQKEFSEDYAEPTMVLFSGYVTSACGQASSATGPFYCPGDQKLYIDLSFYRDMKEKLNAPGDFAMAYVVAHEVGHHIQYLMGITEKVHSQRRNLSEKAYNKLSVRLELQADFLAGVWAHHAQETKNILEEGDIEEALNAANAIGDDRLQKQAQGEVVPDAFTHGTSAQRVKWFKKGFDSGDINQGNTFEYADHEL